MGVSYDSKMAGQTHQNQSTELFDSYFRRADSDQDGRISGAEAVSFFQSTSLTKQVLAQIWTHADQNRTGFLGRAEFYNALKLVTVAQSNQELTPNIVNAALHGPASAKIPLPQLNLAAIPAPQSNSLTASPVSQLCGSAPTTSHSVGSLQSAFSQQPLGQHQQVQSAVKLNQQALAHSSTASASTGFPVGAGNSTSGQSQIPWPRMTQTDIQKYMRVFVEVDTDRDGKISGEQARNLFLSWRLPREVLKYVWELSDLDNDGMLSSLEFCVALYLMERYREGRPLPTVFPSDIVFGETKLSAAGQCAPASGNANLGSTPGFHQQRGMQPSSQVSMPQPDEDVQPSKH